MHPTERRLIEYDRERTLPSSWKSRRGYSRAEPEIYNMGLGFFFKIFDATIQTKNAIFVRFWIDSALGIEIYVVIGQMMDNDPFSSRTPIGVDNRRSLY